MAEYSQHSIDQLEDVHPDLQKVMWYVLTEYGFDHKIVEGLRTQKRQQELYAQGRTKPGPIVTHIDGVTRKSNHQAKDDGYGYAVDAYPYPIDLSAKRTAIARFYYFAGLVKAAAKELKERGEITHNIRSGLDWDSDGVFSDQTFHDAPHFELYES